MSAFGFQWHLSDRCNLRCAHCYQDDFSDRSERGADFWLELLERLSRELTPDESLVINLTGGEPLLLDDLPILLRALEDNPHVAEWQLISNGTIAAGAAFDALAGCGKLSAIKLSFESGRDADNDRVRGVGSLEKLRGNLEAFRGLGKPLVGMVTLGAHNAGGLEGCWNFVLRQDLDGLLLERFVPLGHGRSLSPGPLDEAGWCCAMEQLAEAAGLELEADNLAWVRALWLRRLDGGEVLVDAAGCELGESMALMPDGRVFACRRMPRSVGNLSRESLGEIRRRLKAEIPLAGGCRALTEALLR